MRRGRRGGCAECTIPARADACSDRVMGIPSSDVGLIRANHWFDFANLNPERPDARSNANGRVWCAACGGVGLWSGRGAEAGPQALFSIAIREESVRLQL